MTPEELADLALSKRMDKSAAFDFGEALKSVPGMALGGTAIGAGLGALAPYLTEEDDTKLPGERRRLALKGALIGALSGGAAPFALEGGKSMLDAALSHKPEAAAANEGGAAVVGLGSGSGQVMIPGVKPHGPLYKFYSEHPWLTGAGAGTATQLATNPLVALLRTRLNRLGALSGIGVDDIAKHLQPFGTKGDAQSVLDALNRVPEWKRMLLPTRTTISGLLPKSFTAGMPASEQSALAGNIDTAITNAAASGAKDQAKKIAPGLLRRLFGSSVASSSRTTRTLGQGQGALSAAVALLTALSAPKPLESPAQRDYSRIIQDRMNQ